MPIQEPFIQAMCDKCEEVTDGMEMTSLAGGGWDARNIKKRLEREGWKIDGETTICPECVAHDAAKETA